MPVDPDGTNDQMPDGPLKLAFALREGITANPREGDETTRWWLELANKGSLQQRVSAYIVLLQQGLGLEVRLISGGSV